MSEDCPEDCEICDGQGGIHDVIRERDEARADLRRLKVAVLDWKLAAMEGRAADEDAACEAMMRLAGYDDPDPDPEWYIEDVIRAARAKLEAP